MGYRTSFLVVMLLALGIVGCDGLIGSGDDLGNDPSNPGGPDFPVDTTRPELASCDSFEPAAPFVYAAKIKTLLTGLGLTAEELDALTADPNVLRTQIESWLDMPQADEKLRRFFQTAFQQDGYEQQALVDLWGYNNFQMGRLSDGTQVDDAYIRTFEESFARTVLDIVRADRPFTDVLTTQTVYLTTAQMVGLALSDDREIDDDGDRSYNRSRGMIDQIAYTTANVPLSETLNPNSPNWMRFTIPAEGLPGRVAGRPSRRTTTWYAPRLARYLATTPTMMGACPTTTARSRFSAKKRSSIGAPSRSAHRPPARNRRCSGKSTACRTSWCCESHVWDS